MGQTGLVFRAPARDRHGDAINEDGSTVSMLDVDGNAFVGEIKNIIMGGMSASPSMSSEESSDTRGMIGCPRKSSVLLQFGDRIEINDVRYRVVSRPEWNYRHGLTGTDFGYYWVDIEGTIG